MDEDKSTATLDQEWENRVLCSDESCIGIIGPDGRCKECGLAYEGPLPLSSEAAQSGEPADPPPLADDAPGDDTAGTAQAPTDADLEWDQRRLCSDESCIGVIGPDGRCKECGRPYGDAP